MYHCTKHAFLICICILIVHVLSTYCVTLKVYESRTYQRSYVTKVQTHPFYAKFLLFSHLNFSGKIISLNVNREILPYWVGFLFIYVLVLCMYCTMGYFSLQSTEKIETARIGYWKKRGRRREGPILTVTQPTVGSPTVYLSRIPFLGLIAWFLCYLQKENRKRAF